MTSPKKKKEVSNLKFCEHKTGGNLEKPGISFGVVETAKYTYLII